MCLKWENVFWQITHYEFLANLFYLNNTVLSGHAPVTLVIATGEDFPSLPRQKFISLLLHNEKFVKPLGEKK